MSENKPQDDAAMPPASDGSVGEPLAWAVARSSDEFVARVELFEACAIRESDRRGDGWVVVPLYRKRHAILSPEEREAIADGIECCEDITYGGTGYQESANVLRELLKRTR